MTAPFRASGNRCYLIVHVGAAVVVLWMSIAGEWIKQRIRLNAAAFGYMDGVILCRAIRIWGKRPGISAGVSNQGRHDEFFSGLTMWA